MRDTGPPPPRSLTLAVLAGLGVIVGGSILSRVVAGIVYLTLIPESDGPPRPSVEALSAPLSSMLITIVILGCVFSALGGYVCARVARRLERRVTLVLAVLTTAIGFTTVAAGGTFTALLLTLTFACVMGGGGLGRYSNLAERRKTDAAMAA